ncbi:MAG: hypothetical protein BWX84_00899 [Verrucomicrobia bacterium ADurb.Bin118]|nr:MAG: hypothetical protein BWX84_00899 [Verrucomicrobia bacterium ADurb.Bin118]
MFGELGSQFSLTRAALSAGGRCEAISYQLLKLIKF